MSSSCWMLIRSRLPDPVGGFIFDQRGTPASPLLPQFTAQHLWFRVCTDGLQFFQNKGETTMEFFNSAIEVL